MAIVKKQYPTYTLLNNDIKGKVLLALPTSGERFNNTILRSQYSSAPIYVSTGLIVGMATGNYRLTGISHMQGWFIEVEQFLPSLDDNGIPYKSREIYVPFSAGFTPVDCEWHDLNSPVLKKKIMLFSLGQIGYDQVGIWDLKVPADTSYRTYNAYIAEYMYDHTPKSEYEKWLNFFEITRYDDDESTIQLGSVPSITKHTPAAEGINYWWDGTADGPMRAGYYITKNAIEFYPNAWYDGIKPRRAYILASTSPEFDKDSPGVIFSAAKEVEGDPFDIGRIRIYGLEAGQTYYFKTLIEGYPYSFGPTHKDHGYDNSITSFSYGDELALTMPEFDVEPMLVPLRITDIGTNSIKVDVGFEYIGTIGTIAEAGICYIKDYYDRAPLITDGKATTPLRSELTIASINITGLDAGSKYRLRTYVKMDNGDVLYCDENDIYNAWTPATPVDGYVVWGGGVYETRRSFTRIPLEKIEGGVRKITATTTGSGKRLGAVTMSEPYAIQKINSNGAIVSFKVLDYGEYSYAETTVGLCWTEAPDEYPDINDNILVANPWDNPNTSNFNSYSDIAVNVDELDSNKKYFIRAFIQNPSGVSYAPFAKPLNTLMTNEEIYNLTGIKLSAPSISKVTINSAEISSSVEKHDGGVKAGILMKALSAPTSISDKVYEIDAAAVEMKYSATGLTPSTTYYVVPFVTTDDDIILGPPGTFKTGDITAVSKPTVSLDSVSAVGSTFMEVSIVDVSNGGAPVSEIGIAYSKSTILATSEPSTYSVHTTKYLSSGNKYTYRIDGLDANTIYYVAAYSINSAGFAYSSSRPVKTDSSIGAPIVSVSDLLNSSESHIAVSASVTKTESIGSMYIVYSSSPFTTGSLDIDNLPAGISKKPIVSTSVDKWSMDKGVPYSKVVNIVGLTPGSTVYYAAFASNSVAGVYSDVKSASTVGVSDPGTSIDCTYSPGSSTLTMTGTVSTADSVLKIGYLWASGVLYSVAGLANESLSSMNGNRFSMQFVAPKANTEYTVAAFVDTKKGRFYAPIMNYLSAEAGSGTVVITPDSPVVPNTGMFNPPSDPNQKRYSHMYDGVTRTWRRNSEGNWEREPSQQPALPIATSIQDTAVYSSLSRSHSIGTSESQLADSLIYEAASGIHYSIFGEMNPSDRYTEVEAPYLTYEVFRIFLGENPMFKYNASTNITEDLYVSAVGGGPTNPLFISSPWNYEPSTNSISRSISELDTAMISEVNSAIDLVRNGISRFRIVISGYTPLPTLVRPSSNRKFLAEDMYIKGYGNSLENYYRDSISYQITLGATGIDGANSFSYLSPFTSMVAEANNTNQYEEPSLPYIAHAPMSGKIDRVFGTIHVSGDLTIGEVYSLVLHGADAQEERVLGQIFIGGPTESCYFIGGADFDEKIITETGNISLSLHKTTVTPGSESNGISIIATILMKSIWL